MTMLQEREQSQWLIDNFLITLLERDSYSLISVVLCVTEKEAHTMLNHMRELQKNAGILSAHDGEDPGFVISEGK